MITLDVRDYCHGCPFIDVEQHGLFLEGAGKERVAEVSITCKHIERCKMIEEHIRESIDKERANV